MYVSYHGKLCKVIDFIRKPYGMYIVLDAYPEVWVKPEYVTIV